MVNLFRKKKFINNVWKTLNNAKPVALLTTGRAGSDFFQSLFDGHTQVLTFNGSFFFHNFWLKSKIINFSSPKINLDKLIDEFVDSFTHKFHSKMDLIENKHKLGMKKNKSIKINLIQYKFCLKKILEKKKINSKNFLLASTAVYEILLGRNILKKKVFLHHHHRIRTLNLFENDFANSKKICMYRDPRQLYSSGILNWNKYEKKTRSIAFNYYVLSRSITEIQSIKDKKNTLVVKLETLGNKDIILKICDWLNIKYEKTLARSTFGGLQWWSDKISLKKKAKHELGFSNKMIKTSWRENFYFHQKIVLNHIMHKQIKHYNYKIDIGSHFYWIPLVLFFIFLPFKNEVSYFSLKNIIKNSKIFTIKQIAHYGIRIILCYKFLLLRYFFQFKKFNFFDKKYS